MTGKNYETIWLEPGCADCDCVRQWCQDNVWSTCEFCGLEPVKYVRADKVEALEKEREDFAKLYRLMTTDACNQVSRAEAAEDALRRIADLSHDDYLDGEAHTIATEYLDQRKPT